MCRVLCGTMIRHFGGVEAEGVSAWHHASVCDQQSDLFQGGRAAQGEIGAARGGEDAEDGDISTFSLSRLLVPHSIELNYSFELFQLLP